MRLHATPAAVVYRDLDGSARLGELRDSGGPTRTHALRLGSDAVNSADDVLAPPRDQRGVSRPQGPHADIGAFEREG